MTSPNAPIAALIFDMDGLLVDTEPYAERALVELLRQHGHDLRPSTMQSTLGKRLPEAMAIVAEEYGLDAPQPDLVTLFDDLRYAALRGNVQPLPGAVELIRYGRESGLRIGLATSGTRRHVDLSLGEAGLAGLFDAETTGDEVRHSKPAPDIFLLAAERLSVRPEQSVVLEDAPAGLAAAAAAGMRRIWVPNAATRSLVPAEPPTATLPDLHAMIGWLRRHGVGKASAV